MNMVGGMRFTVVMKNERGETIYQDIVEANDRVHAIKIALFMVEAWKIEEARTLQIEVQQVS
jgi:hypothetical protein